MIEPSLVPRLLGDEATKVFYHYAVTLRFQLILHPRDHLVQILLWNKKQSIQPLLLDLDVFEEKFDGVIGERVEVNVTKAKALKANFGTSKDMENVRNDVISGLLVEFVQEHLQIEGGEDNQNELKVLLPEDYLYTEPILLLQPEEKHSITNRIDCRPTSDFSATLRALDRDWAQENLPSTLRSSFNFASFDPIQERRANIRKIFHRAYEKIVSINRAKKIKAYFQKMALIEEKEARYQQFLKQQQEKQEKSTSSFSRRSSAASSSSNRRPSAIPTGLLRRMDSLDYPSSHSVSSVESNSDSSTPGSPGTPLLRKREKSELFPMQYVNGSCSSLLSEKSTNVPMTPAYDEHGELIPFVVGSVNHDDLYNAIYLGNSPATDVPATPKLPFIGGPFVAGSKRPTSSKQLLSVGSTNSDDLMQLSKNPKMTTVTCGLNDELSRSTHVNGGSAVDLTPLSNSGHGVLQRPKTLAPLDRPKSPAPLSMDRPKSPVPLSTDRPRSPTGHVEMAATISSRSTNNNNHNEHEQGIMTTPLMSSSSCSNLSKSPEGFQPIVSLKRNSSYSCCNVSTRSLSSSDSVSSFDLPTLHEQEEVPSTMVSPLLSSDVNKSVRNISVVKRGASSEKVMSTTGRSRSPIFPLPAIAGSTGSRNGSLAGSRVSSRPTSRSTSRNVSPAGSRRSSLDKLPAQTHGFDAELVRYYPISC